MSVLEKVLGQVKAYNKILEQEKMWKDKEKEEHKRSRRKSSDEKGHCKYLLKFFFVSILVE